MSTSYITDTPRTLGFLGTQSAQHEYSRSLVYYSAPHSPCQTGMPHQFNIPAHSANAPKSRARLLIPVTRFGRDASRNDLFSSYNRSTSPSKSKGKGKSPYGASPGYGYTPPASTDHLGPGFGAYPGPNGTTPTASGSGSGRGSADPTFRSATPNSRGQYSAAVLDELESQNEEQVGVLTGKVKMLKDVSCLFFSGACRAGCGCADNGHS